MRVLMMSAVALTIAGATSLGAQDRAGSVTLGVPADARVRINNPTGPTTVIGWDRNEVRAEAISGNIRDLNVRTDGRRVDLVAPTNMALTVRVPRRSMLDVRAGSGPVVVRDVENTIDVESGSGAVMIEATARSITAVGFSGGVQIRGGGTEITRAESASGSVSVSEARGVIDLSSSSGSVSARGQVRDAKLFTVSGSVAFDGVVESGGRLSLETTSGSVSLRLPAETAAVYELSTVSGHIQNAFGPRVQPSTHGHGATLRFAIRGGGARIKASTLSGSVVLNER